MKTISLTKGFSAIVDDADFEWLMQWEWHCIVNKRNKYAVRSLHGIRMHGIRMHRVIINAPSGILVDHIDGNGLNNQRSNLRLCTNAQNMRNMKISPRGTSQYKGVQWRKDHSKWQTSIMSNYRRYHIGYFTSEVEAARAYDAAAIRHFGEFACLNFPQEDI
jgi:HNH endonuclease